MNPETLTISPITCNNGCYTWTVTDDNGEHTYYTNNHGEGIFTDEYTTIYNNATGKKETVHSGGNKQIQGTAQFSLANCSSSARRQRVVAFHARQSQNYIPWLDDMTDTQQNAVNFYQHLQHHDNIPCCQALKLTEEDL